MTVNRKSRTTAKFTSKMWSISFLTKRNKKALLDKFVSFKPQETKLDLILSKIDKVPSEREYKFISKGISRLDLHEKKRLIKILKSRNYNTSIDELMELLK